ncbi:hypothetical protein JXB01_01475 [Candidatus Micrarchaeota archaeon]|nr:hypothetical protein [Candidatus Micrarchaeota archaeon]
MSFDFDAMLVKKVSEANNTRVGRFLLSLSRSGGITLLTVLHILCTSALGIAVTYPIYLFGGVWAALPTGLFTIFVVSLILVSFVSYRLGIRNSIQRKMIIFAVLFSLPFGLLSMPLLYALSQK